MSNEYAQEERERRSDKSSETRQWAINIKTVAIDSLVLRHKLSGDITGIRIEKPRG